MKKVLILAFILPVLISCNKEEATTSSSSELIGEWFRSAPVRVWAGHDKPIEERGDRQVIVSFLEDGTFIYNTTTLGLYENTTIQDTSGYNIQYGTYVLDGNQIDIELEKYIWFDTFYGDMIEPETITYNKNILIKFRFRDASFEIDEPKLTFTHHTLTDLLSPEQETPGIDKHIEEYIRIQ